MKKSYQSNQTIAEIKEGGGQASQHAMEKISLQGLRNDVEVYRSYRHRSKKAYQKTNHHKHDASQQPNRLIINRHFSDITSFKNNLNYEDNQESR